MDQPTNYEVIKQRILKTDSVLKLIAEKDLKISKLEDVNKSLFSRSNAYQKNNIELQQELGTYKNMYTDYSSKYYELKIQFEKTEKDLQEKINISKEFTQTDYRHAWTEQNKALELQVLKLTTELEHYIKLCKCVSIKVGGLVQNVSVSHDDIADHGSDQIRDSFPGFTADEIMLACQRYDHYLENVDLIDDDEVFCILQKMKLIPELLYPINEILKKVMSHAFVQTEIKKYDEISTQTISKGFYGSGNDFATQTDLLVSSKSIQTEKHLLPEPLPKQVLIDSSSQTHSNNANTSSQTEVAVATPKQTSVYEALQIVRKAKSKMSLMSGRVVKPRQSKQMMEARIANRVLDRLMRHLKYDANDSDDSSLLKTIQLKKNEQLLMARLNSFRAANNLAVSDTDSSIRNVLVKRKKRPVREKSQDSACILSEVSTLEDKASGDDVDGKFVDAVLEEMQTIPRVVSPIIGSPKQKAVRNSPRLKRNSSLLLDYPQTKKKYSDDLNTNQTIIENSENNSYTVEIDNSVSHEIEPATVVQLSSKDLALQLLQRIDTDFLNEVEEEHSDISNKESEIKAAEDENIDTLGLGCDNSKRLEESDGNVNTRILVQQTSVPKCAEETRSVDKGKCSIDFKLSSKCEENGLVEHANTRGEEVIRGKLHRDNNKNKRRTEYDIECPEQNTTNSITDSLPVQISDVKDELNLDNMNEISASTMKRMNKNQKLEETECVKVSCMLDPNENLQPVQDDCYNSDASDVSQIAKDILNSVSNYKENQSKSKTAIVDKANDLTNANDVSSHISKPIIADMLKTSHSPPLKTNDNLKRPNESVTLYSDSTAEIVQLKKNDVDEIPVKQRLVSKYMETATKNNTKKSATTATSRLAKLSRNIKKSSSAKLVKPYTSVSKENSEFNGIKKRLAHALTDVKQKNERLHFDVVGSDVLGPLIESDNKTTSDKLQGIKGMSRLSCGNLLDDVGSKVSLNKSSDKTTASSMMEDITELNLLDNVLLSLNKSSKKTTAKNVAGASKLNYDLLETSVQKKVEKGFGTEQTFTPDKLSNCSPDKTDSNLLENKNTIQATSTKALDVYNLPEENISSFPNQPHFNREVSPNKTISSSKELGEFGIRRRISSENSLLSRSGSSNCSLNSCDDLSGKYETECKNIKTTDAKIINDFTSELKESENCDEKSFAGSDKSSSSNCSFSSSNRSLNEPLDYSMSNKLENESSARLGANVCNGHEQFEKTSLGDKQSRSLNCSKSLGISSNEAMNSNNRNGYFADDKGDETKERVKLNLVRPDLDSPRSPSPLNYDLFTPSITPVIPLSNKDNLPLSQPIILQSEKYEDYVRTSNSQHIDSAAISNKPNENVSTDKNNSISKVNTTSFSSIFDPCNIDIQNSRLPESRLQEKSNYHTNLDQNIKDDSLVDISDNKQNNDSINKSTAEKSNSDSSKNVDNFIKSEIVLPSPVFDPFDNEAENKSNSPFEPEDVEQDSFNSHSVISSLTRLHHLGLFKSTRSTNKLVDKSVKTNSRRTKSVRKPSVSPSAVKPYSMECDKKSILPTFGGVEIPVEKMNLNDSFELKKVESFSLDEEESEQSCGNKLVNPEEANKTETMQIPATQTDTKKVLLNKNNEFTNQQQQTNTSQADECSNSGKIKILSSFTFHYKHDKDGIAVINEENRISEAVEVPKTELATKPFYHETIISKKKFETQKNENALETFNQKQSIEKVTNPFNQKIGTLENVNVKVEKPKTENIVEDLSNQKINISKSVNKSKIENVTELFNHESITPESVEGPKTEKPTQFFNQKIGTTKNLKVYGRKRNNKTNHFNQEIVTIKGVHVKDDKSENEIETYNHETSALIDYEQKTVNVNLNEEKLENVLGQFNTETGTLKGVDNDVEEPKTQKTSTANDVKVYGKNPENITEPFNQEAGTSKGVKVRMPQTENVAETFNEKTSTTKGLKVKKPTKATEFFNQETSALHDVNVNAKMPVEEMLSKNMSGVDLMRSRSIRVGKNRVILPRKRCRVDDDASITNQVQFAKAIRRETEFNLAGDINQAQTTKNEKKLQNGQVVKIEKKENIAVMTKQKKLHGETDIKLADDINQVQTIKNEKKLLNVEGKITNMQKSVTDPHQTARTKNIAAVPKHLININRFKKKIIDKITKQAQFENIEMKVETETQTQIVDCNQHLQEIIVSPEQTAVKENTTIGSNQITVLNNVQDNLNVVDIESMDFVLEFEDDKPQAKNDDTKTNKHETGSRVQGQVIKNEEKLQNDEPETSKHDTEINCSVAKKLRNAPVEIFKIVPKHSMVFNMYKKQIANKMVNQIQSQNVKMKISNVSNLSKQALNKNNVIDIESMDFIMEFEDNKPQVKNDDARTNKNDTGIEFVNNISLGQIIKNENKLPKTSKQEDEINCNVVKAVVIQDQTASNENSANVDKVDFNMFKKQINQTQTQNSRMKLQDAKTKTDVSKIEGETNCNQQKTIVSSEQTSINENAATRLNQITHSKVQDNLNINQIQSKDFVLEFEDDNPQTNNDDTKTMKENKSTSGITPVQTIKNEEKLENDEPNMSKQKAVIVPDQTTTNENTSTIPKHMLKKQIADKMTNQAQSQNIKMNVHNVENETITGRTDVSSFSTKIVDKETNCNQHKQKTEQTATRLEQMADLNKVDVHVDFAAEFQDDEPQTRNHGIHISKISTKVNSNTYLDENMDKIIAPSVQTPKPKNTSSTKPKPITDLELFGKQSVGNSDINNDKQTQSLHTTSSEHEAGFKNTSTTTSNCTTAQKLFEKLDVDNGEMKLQDNEITNTNKHRTAVSMEQTTINRITAAPSGLRKRYVNQLETTKSKRISQDGLAKINCKAEERLTSPAKIENAAAILKRMSKLNVFKEQDAINVEEFADRSYVTRIPWVKVKVMFSRLVRFQGAKRYEEIVDNALKNMDQDVLCRYILTAIAQDRGEEEKGVTPFEPFLSRKTRVLLDLVLRLQSAGHFVGLVARLMELCETQLLFRSTTVNTMEKLARLYAAMCKMLHDRQRLRKMLLDSMYFMEDMSMPLVYHSLTTWFSLLPRENRNVEEQGSMIEAKPLTKVLIHVVHSKFNKSPEYYLSSLKNLLINYYKYPRERYNENILMREFLEKYMCTMHISYEMAILVLCKNSPDGWVLKQIELVKELILLVRKEEVLAALKSLVKKIAVPFKNNAAAMEKIRVHLNEIGC